MLIPLLSKFSELQNAYGVLKQFYQFFETQATTSLVITAPHPMFTKTFRWMNRNTISNDLARTLTLNWISNEVTVGAGTNWFVFEGRLFRIVNSNGSSKTDGDGNGTDAASITLTTFGRSHKLFDKLIEVIHQSDAATDELNLYRSQPSGYWALKGQRSPRPLDTVDLPAATKQVVMSHLENFWANQEWYAKAGIPWHTGILLYGPPGTGKTSFVKALCSYYKKDFCVLNLASMQDESLKDIMSYSTSKAIVIAEDLDVAGIEARSLDETAVEPNGAIRYVTSGPTLSGILNALDGADSGEGRVLIATSNDITKLDPALLREGRFNLKVEIGYMTNETLKSYINRLYKFNSIDWDSIEIKDGVAPCFVQKLVFDNRDDPNPVIETVTTRKNR